MPVLGPVRGIVISARLIDVRLNHNCRLYFTSFAHPAPRQSTLNGPVGDALKPKIRGTSRGSAPATPDAEARYYYFSVDDQLVYTSFFQDWGPLNLAMVYKSCIYIHQLLVVRTPNHNAPQFAILTLYSVA